jgi:hypothetical protein
MWRAAGRCEHCGWPAVNVHHPRYPRVLGTESAASLVAVCRRCHNLNHGVLNMVRFQKGTHKAALACGALVTDERVGIVYDDRTLYVAPEEFVKGSGISPAILPDLRRRLENQMRYQPAIEHVVLPARHGRPELHCYSTKVWMLAVLVPITLDAQRTDVGFGGLTVAYRVIAENADKVIDWFAKAHRDAFVRSLPSTGVEMIPAPVSNVERLPVTDRDMVMLLARHAAGETVRVDRIDGRVLVLEDKTRLPAACTARDYCLHKRVSYSRQVRMSDRGPQTLLLDNALGRTCKAMGAEPVSACIEREATAAGPTALPHQIWQIAALHEAWAKIRALNPELILPA